MESAAYISSFTEFPVRILSEQDLSVDITQILASGREDQWEGGKILMFYI